ncbi:hypothetical protein [Nannocystis punicea]|uniref:Tetratricopeptide repeat-containing protein n=1 Tax=Nannocystis punicea TaxID=2995304 RepID=A0ABY7HCT0_9BACT|nr:hypothetical protein [Nannocystis poenicansa]WAS97101.1 hypothetical protein O0S08_13215 [Nannocystis poenicansa]
MLRTIVPLALFSATLLLCPAPTRACGGKNLWGPEHDELNKAAHLIEKGRHGEAVAQVRRTVKTAAESASPAPDVDPYVHNRARQLLALAVARSAGAVALGPGLGGKRKEHRRAAVAWAISTMRADISPGAGHVICQLGACRSLDDPAHTAALAEALALAEDSRDEAYRLLKDLGDHDLMPTAQGWAVLAALHRQRGELEAGTAALEHCRQQAAKGVRCDVTL